MTIFDSNSIIAFKQTPPTFWTCTFHNRLEAISPGANEGIAKPEIARCKLIETAVRAMSKAIS
jgi:hypothetical protein